MHFKCTELPNSNFCKIDVLKVLGKSIKINNSFILEISMIENDVFIVKCLAPNNIQIIM